MMLNIDDANELQITLHDLVGKRFAAIGKSGSGKTHTLGVLLEEWLAGGFPAVVIDPLAQFTLLADYYPVVIAGRGNRAHVTITPENAAQLADVSYHERVSVVLDLSLYRNAEAATVLERFFHQLSEHIFSQQDAQPYAVVIDEAHRYAPQVGSTNISTDIIDLAKMGRHKNITTLVATQRAASINKDFLTQANLLFAHRLSFGVDTAVLQEQLPLPAKELNAMMRKLGTGEALVIGDSDLIGFDRDYLTVKVRQRQVGNVEAGVIFEQTALRPLDEGLLDALRTSLVTAPEPTPVPASADLRPLYDHIQRLEREVAAKQVERVEVPVVMPEQAEQFTASATALIALGQSILAALERVANPLVVVSHEVAAPAAPPAAPVPDGDEYKSPLQTERGIKRQEREFEALLADVRTLKGAHRQVLRYLNERPGRQFSVQELARFLGLSSLYLLNEPPLPLIHLGLIKRSGRSGKDFRYWGAARDFLATKFPDLDQDKLLTRLGGG